VDKWGSWSGGRIFERADVTALNNTHKLPVVTIANCLNGYFAGKNVSMAEEFLLRNDKGAAAVWAASGLGYPSGHQALMGEFYEAIFQDDLYLGAATTAAKIAAYTQSSFWGELVETFVLFGDPAMLLGIPVDSPYLESTIPADGAGEVPVDQDLQIVFSKSMDPATVSLSGQGTTGLTFTPSWNSDKNILNYAHHPNFGYGQTLTFTISGQDKLGNPLDPGLVPRTWSFTTVPPISIATVEITGSTKGGINTPYTFEATVSPITVTLPITYVWQGTGQAPVTYTSSPSNVVTFTWHTLGIQVITVTAMHAWGAVSDTHQVTMLPVAVDIAGPTKGAIDAPYTFEATVNPITATLPITYVWQATGQTPVAHTGDLSDTVTFTWPLPGMQTITVTTTNAQGIVTDTHRLAINVPLTSMTIAGPAIGMANTTYVFTATTGPVTATLPITYIWQATQQTPVTHTGGLSDTIIFTWAVPGPQTITTMAMNNEGTTTGIYTVTIDASPITEPILIYLPLILKSE
jgi:hypothetical protein